MASFKEVRDGVFVVVCVSHERAELEERYPRKGKPKAKSKNLGKATPEKKPHERKQEGREKEPPRIPICVKHEEVIRSSPS